jgi:rubredoxin
VDYAGDVNSDEADAKGGEGSSVAPDEREPGKPSERLACPVCGSGRTQPFLHAGPAARVNMKCVTCGHLFKDPHLRR